MKIALPRVLVLGITITGRCTSAPAGALVSYALPIVVSQPTSDSGDHEQAYLDALRERKLYRLLETYCRRRLDQPDVPAADRARYTVELANILTARAQEQTDPDARAELQRQAAELLGKLLAGNPQHPQATGVRFQMAVLELAEGDRLRQQAQLAPQDNTLIESARARLDSAVKAFRQVEADVTQALKGRRPNDNVSTDQPSFNQLLAVQNTARFRLAQALLALAQSYPRHSASQTDYASQAKNQFEAFTQRYSPQEHVVESYLARAECLRLLDDPDEAVKTLKEIEKPETPDKYRDRALVVRAQLLLDQRKPAAARRLIEEFRKSLKAPNPEFELLYVQATLEIAREQSRAQDNLGARQLVVQALGAMDQIEKSHGIYWASRCELLLAELAAERVLVEDPRVLMRMADGQYRRGDRSGAVQTLERAVKLAAESGDADQTVELSMRAASILVQAGEFEDAAQRFAQVATTYPNHPKAPQAQFLVASCLGQAYGADPTPQRLAKYEQALQQHLRTFGSDDTAAEVRWLLGLLRMNQRRWPDAIELFRGISPKHKRFSTARLEIRRAYENWLIELWARSQPTDKVATEAIQYLKQSLAASRGPSLTAEDVPLALTLARIQLHPTIGKYEDAEPLLEQVLFGQEADASQRAEARRLALTALIGQDKFDAAGRMLETEFVGMPQELFAVVQSLEDTAGRSPEARRRQIGKLQLAATERLAQDAEQLTPEQSLQAEIYLALAHVNAGQAVRAEELFDKLRVRMPSNPRVLEAQAECYMQLGRYAQARELWRQLLGMVRENTPVWFRAKYNLALACFNTKDVQQCQKIIQVTTLLHPDLGGPELKAKFEELMAKCQRP
ncbi:MAG: tetratricopeptide repeat protein [Planctomycetes bacterium]|nr:tetratricopeptide repeat protein [Planctomycetota bacterium]